MPMERGHEFDRFPTTHWSLVARAGVDEVETKREALGRLLARYVPPLRAHLVYQRGLSHADAEDAVQQFVTDKVLRRDLIARAERERGKFRTFLLTTLNRWLVNHLRDAAAQKRSPTAAAVMEAGERSGDLVAAGDAADAFDVEWAREVLAHALAHMQAECARTGREDVWGVFQCRLVRPLLDGEQPADYGELVSRFGLQSPAQASNVLMTSKRMFTRALRAVVGEYARQPEEIDTEIAELRDILASVRG
jgi:RNA polymerase sigma-70 factor (ECF subfamily)